MPIYVLVHKWKREHVKTVARKVIEAMNQLPEGTAMCSSYLKADQTGAWCVWQAESDVQLVSYLKKMVPEMDTEAFPVMQFFPPAADLYGIMHSLIS